MKTKLTFIAAWLLLWVKLLNAQAPPPPIIKKVIEIKPSAPVVSWGIELPPLATADLTINVENENYKIKSGPTYSIVGAGPLLWTQTGGAAGGSTFSFKVVNPAVVSASSQAQVTCVWTPKPGTGGGGGGTAPPDINGVATAVARQSLVKSSCAWSFDPPIQPVGSVITYRLTVVDVNGAPATASITNVSAPNTPWTVSGSGPSPVVSTVRSATASTGSLTATYTDAAAKSCTSGTPLYFWDVKHEVKAKAKTDESLTRVKLGLSELVTFSLEPATGVSGSWSIAQGGGTITGAGAFTAPPTADATVKVRVTVDGKTKDVALNVVAPENIVKTNPEKLTYKIREHTDTSAKTKAEVAIEIQPTDVSFSKVQFVEQVGTQTATLDWASGEWAPPPVHDPAPMGHNADNNTFADEIGGQFGKPSARVWPNGSYTWRIPWNYLADGGQLVENWRTYDQIVTTTPISGGGCRVDVQKFGYTATNYTSGL